MDTVSISIGERVKHLRMEKHWNQKEFAKLIGWKPEYLSRFEHGDWGQISPQKLTKLAQMLQVSTDYLLGIEVGDQKTMPINDVGQTRWFYVLNIPHTIVHKVGFTGDVEGRMKQLKKSSFALEIVYVLYTDAAAQLEFVVKQQLYAFVLSGDWLFLETNAILKVVLACLKDADFISRREALYHRLLKQCIEESTYSGVSGGA